MDRRLAWALVPLPGILLTFGLHLGFERIEAERRLQIDETIGVGELVLGAPPPAGFKPVRRRGMLTVLRGNAVWDHPPRPKLEATVTTFDGQVGRITVVTRDSAVARGLRADLVARLGPPMKRRARQGGAGDRWIGKHTFISYDERAGVPGGRVRMIDTLVARHVKANEIDPSAEAEVLPRE